MGLGWVYICYFLRYNCCRWYHDNYIFFCDSILDCKKFKDTVEEIAEQQAETEEKENEEVSTAAEDLVQKLTVTDAGKEENAEKEEAPASDDKKDAKEWRWKACKDQMNVMPLILLPSFIIPTNFHCLFAKMNVCVRWNQSRQSHGWYCYFESPGRGQHVCTIIWSCFWNGQGLMSCLKLEMVMMSFAPLFLFIHSQ